jgi:hypothetical protein
VSRFAVFIVAPSADKLGHWRGLNDVADGIVRSLKQLGHDVGDCVGADEQFFAKDASSLKGRRMIVFNAHRLDRSAVLDDDAIIYNAEQVPIDAESMSDGWRAYVERMRRHVVWDYSEVNIARLRRLDVNRVRLCRVGYCRSKPLTSVEMAREFLTEEDIARLSPPSEDIDVLFFGSMNERRAMLVFDLAQRGLRVETLFGVYGEERDAWIRRSKIVLNVHFYANPIFEIFRVSHALGMKKCVVSENGGYDSELETFAAAATAYVPYGEIAATCEALMKDPEQRKGIAKRGKELFQQLDQVAAVREALEQS